MLLSSSTERVNSAVWPIAPCIRHVRGFSLLLEWKSRSRSHLSPVRVCLDHFNYMLDVVGYDETGIGWVYVVIRDWEPIHVLEGWIELVGVRSTLIV